MKTLNVTVAPGGVAQVEMARPEVFNAFDETMIAELDEVFTALGSDSAVRAIVLAGQGKAFSAGADLQWMKRASVAPHADNLEDARRFAAMLAQVANCPKPTIALVQGVAFGGGVGLACACDFALASEDAKFAVTEVKFGILPSVIGPYLVNAVGKRQALRLALTASRIDAQEALSIGLVQRVVARADLASAAQHLADEVMLNGPGALGEVKALFSTLNVGPVDAAVRELTAQTIARVRMKEEAREGFSAFLEKRPPAWVRAS
jgi:methylglutaconyl-CoA hydratase